MTRPSHSHAIPNQTPEQEARDTIDAMLKTSGWVVPPKTAIDFDEGDGQAIREYTTDCGPADYVFFITRIRAERDAAATAKKATKKKPDRPKKKAPRKKTSRKVLSK